MDETTYTMEDFNLEEDVKTDPLVPMGNYHASVTNVVFDPEKVTINWTFVLSDNGGIMSDGETPIDGATLIYRNWLPVAGDENTPTKNGRSTKRQAKINMLADFAKSLGVDLSTPGVITENLANGTYIGVEADLKISIREYQGRTFNDIKSVSG